MRVLQRQESIYSAFSPSMIYDGIRQPLLEYADKEDAFREKLNRVILIYVALNTTSLLASSPGYC